MQTKHLPLSQLSRTKPLVIIMFLKCLTFYIANELLPLHTLYELREEPSPIADICLDVDNTGKSVQMKSVWFASRSRHGLIIIIQFSDMLLCLSSILG